MWGVGAEVSLNENMYGTGYSDIDDADGVQISIDTGSKFSRPGSAVSSPESEIPAYNLSTKLNVSHLALVSLQAILPGAETASARSCSVIDCLLALLPEVPE